MPAHFLLPAVSFFLLANANLARADALSELASFSAFGPVDLEQLAKGKAKAVRSVPMNSPRYLSVQTCWVAPGPPAQQIESLRRWNPSNHRELNVYLHVAGPDFSRLRDAPRNAAIKSLVRATQELSPKLQISRAEAATFSAGGSSNERTMPPGVVAFWSDLLGARYRAFAAGGTAAQPSYDHTGEPVNPGEQLSGLLRDQDKIRTQFAPLLDTSGIGRGASRNAVQYWELLNVDKKAVLTLGATYVQPGAGGTFQVADISYYASGGFDAGLSFQQMWPVTIRDRPFTLVWRGDMISSAEVANIRGIGRMGAEAMFKKDVSKSVELFLRDTRGSR